MHPMKFFFHFISCHWVDRRAIREQFKALWGFSKQPLEIRSSFCFVFFSVHFGWSLYASFGALISLATGIFIVRLLYVQELQHPNYENEENSLGKFIVRFNCVMEFFSPAALQCTCFFSLSFFLYQLFICLPTFAKHRIIKCITHWGLR